MSFNAASLKLMAEKGLSAHDIAEIAAAAEGPRSAGAERQARYRERKRERDVTRDVTSDCNGFPNERDNLTLPEDALTDDASASSRQPISAALQIWNETAAATGWPTVKTISPTRQRLLSARLRQHHIDGWQAAINRARASPYLAGADPPSWFTFKAENFLKLSEGNYDRRHAESADPTTVALSKLHERFGGAAAVG
jgi:hypothetical protein